MFSITPDQLRVVVPRCQKPTTWATALNEATLLYGIAADLDDLAEFLAQCAHESDAFNRLQENLWYTADRLMQVWPTRFPTLQVAAQYAGQPHKLADFVYSNRMGNGPPESGDGWNFRGRGAIMTTGRDEYAQVAKLIDDPALLACPDRLCVATTAANAAAAWWAANPKLVQAAEAGDTVNVTRIVNGGAVGLAERVRLVAAFRGALTSTT